MMNLLCISGATSIDGSLGVQKHAQEFDPGSLQPDVVVAVGQRHLAPVDNALHVDAVPMGVDQVIDEIRVVDAIDADLDGLSSMRVFMLLADRRIDAFVNVWFRMIGVIGLAFGELRRQVQRIEMMIAPVHVPLQFPGVKLSRLVPVGRHAFRRYVAVARSLVS